MLVSEACERLQSNDMKAQSSTLLHLSVLSLLCSTLMVDTCNDTYKMDISLVRFLHLNISKGRADGAAGDQIA